jgi:protein-disulfide isomerase
VTEQTGAARGAVNWKIVAAAAAAGLLLGGGAVAIGGTGLGGDPEKQRVEKIVREYILANPEIIPEAVERLQSKEVAKVVDQHRAALETPFGGSWAGAPRGDVVLVEFFDYACGFCRRSNPDVDRLLKEDDNLKVVWRELPVLGPDSQVAAEASLAAAKQGKFKQFHEALFEEGRPSAASINAARQKAGVTAAVSRAEAEAEINKNVELARALGASGTPTFVVGDRVLQGAVGYQVLKEAIAEARAGA